MKGLVRPASNEAGLAFSGFAILGAMLVFAPLIMGGNRPLPLLILELAAIVLLCLLLLRPGFEQQLPRPLLITLGTLVALPLLQLLPLPEFVWNGLPGREFYATASDAAGATPEYRAVSLIPYVTESALLVLLVPVSVFLATTATSEAQLKQLINLFIGLAVLQAVIGLAQFGTGSMVVLPVLEGESVSSAHGTYPNSDHLAGFLEMALPVALGLLIANIHIGSAAQTRPANKAPIRQRISRLFSSGIRFNQVALYAAAGLAILLGLIFSHSRTGVALAMLGILLSALVFGRWIGGQRSSRAITAFAVIGIALAIEIGLTTVLSRFTGKGLTDDLRWSIYSGTVQGIYEFFPIGSGFGTYPAVFRRFQPGDVPEFVNHAHNDYLEWLFEGGLAAALVMLACLALYLLRWLRVWPREQRCTPYCFMRIAAGIGLLMMMLHGLVDFNLHIPANAVFFAFLAGVFFHQARQTEPAHSARQAPAPRPPVRPGPAPATLPEPPAPAPEIRNPFAD
jgi:hypothetical protein